MRRKKQSRAKRLTKLQDKFTDLLENATQVDVGLEKPCRRITSLPMNDAGYPLTWALVLGFTAPTCAHLVNYMIEHGINRRSKMPRDRSRTGYKEIHHLCAEKATTAEERKASRSCIENSHLVLLTHKQNMERSPKALSTHCVRNHPFAGDNLVIRTDGSRSCRECLKLKYQNNAERERTRVRVSYIRQRLAAGFSYMPASQHVDRKAGCHPDRKYHARGMCRPCYAKWHLQEAKLAS